MWKLFCNDSVLHPKVGQAIDVDVLAVNLEGDGLDKVEEGREILLPRLGALDLGDLRPHEIDRGGVARKTESAVATVRERNRVQPF